MMARWLEKLLKAFRRGPWRENCKLKADCKIYISLLQL